MPGAAADEFGFPKPPAPGYFADSADHWFCFSGVDPADRDLFRGSMSFLDDVTVMSDHESASCGSLTDIGFSYVAVIAGDPDVRGATTCIAWVNPLVCEQYWVMVSPQAILSEATSVPNFDLNLIKTIRHEIGHTTGLRHSDGGGMLMAGAPDSYRAMKSGKVATDLVFTAYASHHITAHVNPAY